MVTLTVDVSANINVNANMNSLKIGVSESRVFHSSVAICLWEEGAATGFDARARAGDTTLQGARPARRGKDARRNGPMDAERSEAPKGHSTTS
jgi:hypothetical protein